MNKLLLIARSNALLLALLLGAVCYGQEEPEEPENPVNFTDSNLPIFIITTEVDPDTGLPIEIPDDPKVWADLKIIYHPDGSQNFMTDQDTPEFLNYNGRIKIELRGSSSQMLSKKQYGWTTYDDEGDKQNVSLLGMPKENDWILNGLAFDNSLIRDYLNYNLTRNMGQYATRTHYCEVVINGDYRGLYILQEKIKDDSNRVNIEEITEDDNDGVNLTGGYITKSDKTTGGDPVAWSMDSYVDFTDFIHELPKPADVTPAQDAYIHSQFTNLETTSGAGNNDPATGYPSVIDVPTFIDFMIMNEFSSNVDAYQISTFFHKDRGGKLRAGPVWDFNLSLGLDVFADRSKTDVWQFSNGDNEGAKFWTDLFNEETYKCYFAKRWNQLTATGQPLNNDVIDAFIDETVLLIQDAAERNQLRWDLPGFNNEIIGIKEFITARETWITENIGEFAICSDVEVPSLVISGINYNPGTSTEFTESDDQEFIEITNTGTEAVDLTGIYLSELGVSYQFPADATIEAGQKIFLASNATVFEAKHDVTPFGQFVRNMSNSSQKLILSDAFGNKIDEVQYLDDEPWPDADGNGKFLHLTDNTLDNSLATSWTAQEDTVLASTSFTTTVSVKLYPNPVKSSLNIVSANTIKQIDVYDMYGALLQSIKPSADRANVELGSYATGMYIIKVTDDKGLRTEKVIKQ